MINKAESSELELGSGRANEVCFGVEHGVMMMMMMEFEGGWEGKKHGLPMVESGK
jgi:hypothetical protein